jgi:hypothetical protein
MHELNESECGWCGCGNRIENTIGRCKKCKTKAAEDLKLRESLPVGGTSCPDKYGLFAATGWRKVERVTVLKKLLRDGEYDGWLDNAIRALEGD